jgi:hypothetical protein
MKDDLQEIPGVGKSISADLRAIGINRVGDLNGRDPQRLFDALCAKKGPQDRCVLYVLRCAVYYASGKRKPRLLKWWNWKDINS